MGFQNDNSPKTFPNRCKSEPSGDTLYNGAVNKSLIIVFSTGLIRPGAVFSRAFFIDQALFSIEF